MLTVHQRTTHALSVSIPLFYHGLVVDSATPLSTGGDLASMDSTMYECSTSSIGMYTLPPVCHQTNMMTLQTQPSPRSL